jgi:hypothetical protein
VRYARFALLAVALVATYLGACKDECSHNSDCAAMGGKSCAPRDAWCESGKCQFFCGQLCQTTISDANACADGVCTDPGHSTPVPAHCTVAPIACTTPSDCPLYRAPDTSGAQLDWTCEQGVCAYPGLNYIKGQP